MRVSVWAGVKWIAGLTGTTGAVWITRQLWVDAGLWLLLPLVELVAEKWISVLFPSSIQSQTGEFVGICSTRLKIVFFSSRKWREARSPVLCQMEAEVTTPDVQWGSMGKRHLGSHEEEVRGTGSLSPGLLCQSNTVVPKHHSLVMPHIGMLLRCAIPFLAGWVVVAAGKV